MYHSFLIHSSADGHLGCFHVLASSAAMNIGVHVSLSYSSLCLVKIYNELFHDLSPNCIESYWGASASMRQCLCLAEAKPLWLPSGIEFGRQYCSSADL